MTSQIPAQTTATTAQRVGWAVLIAATLFICYFSHLGVIGFVGPDEPRYAWIARDMAETGDWITPRLYGKPWFEKPPLLYWGGAIFFRLIPGQPEVAARLPSAISALLATLALAWLAWRTYGGECARWLLLLLPTSVGMIGFSHAAATDMPFAGMLTIAMVCAAVLLGLAKSEEERPILPHTPWLALLLFGFFLGLAVLAKGPAAIILCGGAVFFWAIFTKRWRDALRLLHPAAIATFCVTALPWYILCARRNPDFFRIFIIEHNFKRFLTPEFQHVQPFWFYIPILCIAFLPWIGALSWSVFAAWKNENRHPLSLFLLTWSIFCLAFFTLSKSKLPGYILPAIPPVGLLLARTIQHRVHTYRKSFLLFAIVTAAAFAIVAALLFEIGHLTAPHSRLNGRAGAAFGLLALLFSLSNLFLIFIRWKRVTDSAISLPPFAAIPILAAVLLAPVFVSASFEYDPSGQTIAREIESPVVTPEFLFVGPMQRGKHYGLNFYLGREIPDWDPDHPAEGALLLKGKFCTDVVPPTFACGEPAFLADGGAYLYPITRVGSLDGAGGGREPQ